MYRSHTKDLKTVIRLWEGHECKRGLTDGYAYKMCAESGRCDRNIKC